MAGIVSLLCFTILAREFIGTIAIDYCQMRSCFLDGLIHTVCKFPHSGAGLSCKQPCRRGFTDAEKDAIVEQHNNLRQKVASGQETRGKTGPQPAAVRMPNLVWDSELEMIAQRLADQCTYGHDACRDVQRFWVGQNIAMISTSGENDSHCSTMIQAWYDEVAQFDRNYISSFDNDPDGNKIGHYTQMVWADTITIGCGRIMFEKPDGWMAHYLVCNYGPSGNLQYQKIYEIRE